MTERRYVWLAPLATTREFASRTVTVDLKPAHVWTLLGHRDEHRPPHARLVPMHGLNASLEDEGHDWRWTNGVLRYSSGVVSPQTGIWLLVEGSEVK